jgi:hypothetical protein
MTPEAAAAGPLAYAFDGRPPCVHGIHSSGPGGHLGPIIAHPDASPVGYYPDRQKWEPFPDDSGIWLGWFTDKPMPGPDDLKRVQVVGKYAARLGDGRDWSVPLAMTPDKDGKRSDTPFLPKTRRLRRDGTIEKRPSREYEALYLMADELWDAFQNQIELSDAREWAICAEALRLNYRISHAEISALGLLTDSGIRRIAFGVVDMYEWPSFKAAVAAIQQQG